MLYIIKSTLLVLSVLSLFACGGGSGSSDSPEPLASDNNTTKSFTVGLDHIDIKRVSNGDDVEVNLSEVKVVTLALNR